MGCNNETLMVTYVPKDQKYWHICPKCTKALMRWIKRGERWEEIEDEIRETSPENDWPIRQ